MEFIRLVSSVLKKIKENGMVIPPSMGTSTAINFQPTGGQNAAITGDFVLTAEEVNPVIRVLRNHDIEVEAVHNHMLFEEPRLFFVHFWANDYGEKLAKGLRKVIEKINSKLPDKDSIRRKMLNTIHVTDHCKI